jgi:hypothetical protein
METNEHGDNGTSELAAATAAVAAKLLGKDDDFVKDPMEEIEEKLSKDIIGQAKATILSLVREITPDNSARVLRMIETIAEHHREMVASLGLGKDILNRRKKKAPSWAGDPLSGYESGAGLSDSETFGAQAVQQISSTLNGVLGKPYEGRNVESLVNALATAKESELDEALTTSIRAKLDGMLSAPAKPVLPTNTAVEEDREEDFDAQ